MVEIPIIQFLNENLRKCSKSWVVEISCLFCKNRFKSSRENEGSRGKQLSLGSSTRALFCSQWDVSVIAKSHAIPFQPTTYKQKENWSSRQQQRKATAWHGWKPKPGEVKVESSKDDRLDLVFVRELLLPWRSLAPAVPNLVLLSNRSQNTEKVMLLTRTLDVSFPTWY